MKPEDAALTAVGVTLLTSAVLVVYLHRALNRVLEDACGNADRGQFWAGCAHVLLVLVPLVVQLACAEPNPTSRSDPGSGLWLTLAQLKWGLLGLVGTVVALAAGIGLVGRSGAVPVWVDAEHADDLNRLMARVRELRAEEIVKKAERAEDD
jgi:hypothetical protein